MALIGGKYQAAFLVELKSLPKADQRTLYSKLLNEPFFAGFLNSAVGVGDREYFFDRNDYAWILSQAQATESAAAAGTRYFENLFLERLKNAEGLDPETYERENATLFLPKEESQYLNFLTRHPDQSIAARASELILGKKIKTTKHWSKLPLWDFAT